MKLDPIDRAFERLKGYCAKIYDCQKCRFCKNGICVFRQETPPCDWNKEDQHD